MDFEVVPAGETLDFLAKAPAPGVGDSAVAPSEDAEALFQRGVDLETRDPATAEAAYRRAIALAPNYVDPYLNLGVMLCDAGRCEDAVSLYQAALHQQPDEALLHFNLAVALEDLDRVHDALASYARCIQLAPGFADAHYNAARLHERLGHATQAIRHYSAYRRLQK
jgi:tetratricopeptide (TPR) repeat protein